MTLEVYHHNWLTAHPDRTEDWLKARLYEGFDIHHMDGEQSIISRWLGIGNRPKAIDWSLTPARRAFKDRILKENGNKWSTIRLGRRPLSYPSDLMLLLFYMAAVGLVVASIVPIAWLMIWLGLANG